LATLVCKGGPHDGRQARSLRRSWTFIDHDGATFEHDGLGRALYERGHESWVYPGENAYVCVGCGALVGQDAEGDAVKPCPLCGHA
jgi:hypothetical protein